jgi:hypothetical protein
MRNERPGSRHQSSTRNCQGEDDLTRSEIERLAERVAALNRSQPGRKRPTLMSEPEGEAWIHYCVSLLTEEERLELEQIQADIKKNDQARPSWRSPEWTRY